MEGLWKYNPSTITSPPNILLIGAQAAHPQRLYSLQNKRGKSVTNITGGGAGSSRAELSNYLIHRHISSKLALFKPASSSEIRNDSNLCYCVLNLHFSCFTRSNPPLRDADNSDNDV